MITNTAIEKWTSARSAELYRVDAWGGGYFGIDPSGHLVVYPEQNPAQKVDLYNLVCSLIRREIDCPLLLRFDGIIRHRVRVIQQAFKAAIDEFKYQGNYHLVYPIKVNQQRHVVDSVRRAGRDNEIGLEVGSKPELLAVLAIHDTPNGLLLCNGYKDAEYIELALLARKLGRRSIIVIEQLYEIDTVMDASRRLGVEPELGMRINPLTKGSGRWEGSAGDKARFGLNSYEVISAVERLKANNSIDWIKLLHFHVGSQIPSINAIKNVLREATRMYAELARLCPSLCMFDVGGGLAVDYDGSRTNFSSSMNYTVEEYARDVVWAIMAMCEEEKIPHPGLLSESGRAIVAQHAVLVTEVTDVAPALDAIPELEPPPTQHDILRELYGLYQDLTIKNVNEVFHDALSLKEEVLQRFVAGDLSLLERAYADRICKHLLAKVEKVTSGLKNVPEDMQRLGEIIRDMYFCNFSVFQSLPDLWAIDHLFPVMPIHRLQDEPTRRAMIADLTCDSDGKIERFIDSKEVKSYIKLHELRPGEPYYIGLFFVGAYQEILGDLHNLFGDTNAVHVEVGQNGDVEFTCIVAGDTVREVLSYVQFDAQDLTERLRRSIEKSLRDGSLTPEDSAKLQRRFREGLEGYTYLVV
jgi:arginine decarboxylase